VPAEDAFIPEDASRPAPLQVVYGRYNVRSLTNTVSELNRHYKIPIFDDAGSDKIVTILVVRDVSNSFCKKICRKLGIARRVNDFHFVQGQGGGDAFVCNGSIIETAPNHLQETKLTATGPIEMLIHLNKDNPDSQRIIKDLGTGSIQEDEIPVLVTYRLVDRLNHRLLYPSWLFNILSVFGKN